MSHATFMCHHLLHSTGAGFFGDFGRDPRPDAWCARCDEVLAAWGDWNEENERFAQISLVCAGCYDEIRARNEWRPVSDAEARFTCAGCGQIHDGLPRDFGMPAPALTPEALSRATLTSDTCTLGDEHFVRACLELPIIGGPGPFVYGVWVSLSQQSFEQFMAHATLRTRYLDGPYFGWFCTELAHWPSTLHLKTRVHLRPPPLRPVIELEPTDHPLAVAQREGITVERYRELALAHLHDR
jgi:hypothetical protein